MKKYVKVMVIFLCLTIFGSGCGREEGARQETDVQGSASMETPSAQEDGSSPAEWSQEEWLLQTAGEIADAVVRLASDEVYLEAMGNPDELLNVINDWKTKKPGKDGEIIVLKTDNPELFSMILDDVDMEACSEFAREYLRHKIGTNLANVLNAHLGGSSVLAASSVVAYSRTYVPDGEVDDQVLILPCEGQMGICISYTNTGDGAITASGTYVVMPDDEMNRMLREYLPNITTLKRGLE